METFNDVINSGQLVLADFFATWCGPCKAMHPVLEQLKANLGDRLRIIKVDVYKHGHQIYHFGRKSLPSFR
jgi:thioredoxin 1